MKTNKLMALFLVAAMVLSMIPAAFAETEASVNFEDGQMGFVAIYDGMANSADASLELVDYNGSKAVKVTNNDGKVPYVAIDVVSLLGDKAADVAAIEMMIGTENPDGKFYACSGKAKLFAEGKLGTELGTWSVYMEKKNPNAAKFEMGDAAFSADISLIVISMETDNGASKGAAAANMFIDDIRFLDAAGNLIAADTSASFAAPAGFSNDVDMSNLQYLKDTVEIPGMGGKSSTAWNQDGVEFTEEVLAALVPGSVIEVSFSSTSGDLWLVFPDAASWTRIQQQTAAINDSQNIMQITFEQIAEVLGEDTSAWGGRIQCESSGDWEVYAAKVGVDSGLKNLADKVELPDFAVSNVAWNQTGRELTAEEWALFVPGAVIEASYTSTSGDLWLVLPWAESWTRIQQQTAACNGSVMQITYEQIAEVLGDDVATWGAMLQFESSGDWEVYAVSVGTAG